MGKKNNAPADVTAAAAAADSAANTAPPPALAVQLDGGVTDASHASEADDRVPPSPLARLRPMHRAQTVPPGSALSLSSPSSSGPDPRLTPSFRDLRTDQSSRSSFVFLSGPPTALEQERIQTDIENLLLTNLERANEAKERERQAVDAREAELASSARGRGSPAAVAIPAPAFDLRDLLPFFQRGMEVIVQDGFSRCFESSRSQPWNWNLYLWPLWICGVFIRYCILFPIRLTFLLAGLLLVFLLLPILKVAPLAVPLRESLQRKLIRFLCGVFVFSWTGVIKYHGRIPRKAPGQIYVANHTSMIDVIVLSQMNTFSLVGQKHPGWIGFMQDHVLGIIGTVWFQRGEAEDRVKSAKKMRQHIHDPTTNRLLVFPEGTCVNNEYCVQFKQGVFDMDAEVCPIAIKYNKIFVDAFWNSKAQSFQSHLMTLMCSWAVVCDVWYLDPVRIQPGESSIDFSNRVKKSIADKAGLRNVSYDGYLKHFEVKASLVEKQQKMYADVVRKRMTPLEKAQIEEEEAREELEAARAAAHARTQLAEAEEVAQVSSTPASAPATGGVESSSASSTPLAAEAAGPDSLAFSPSPDLPPGLPSPPRGDSHAQRKSSNGGSSDGSVDSAASTAPMGALPPTHAGVMRNSSGGGGGGGGASRQGGLGGLLTSVSSSANLIEMLNAKQEEERLARSAAGGAEEQEEEKRPEEAQELRQRK